VEAQALPGMEAAIEDVEPDEAAQRAAAYRVFASQQVDHPWLDTYYTLREQGWNWRQAIYIAWLAMPEGRRVPRTQHELATEVLGLATDRRLRAWRQENPAIEEEAVGLLRNRVFSAIPAVMEALIESASTPSGRNHADRRTFLEMVGVHFRQNREVPEDLSDLSDAELLRLVEGKKMPGLQGESGE